MAEREEAEWDEMGQLINPINGAKALVFCKSEWVFSLGLAYPYLLPNGGLPDQNNTWPRRQSPWDASERRMLSEAGLFSSSHHASRAGSQNGAR